MRRNKSGASLIESLVALAVFAIGSACTATWLGWTIAVDARASRSVAATIAVANLLERIRANPGGIAEGHYRADGAHSPRWESVYIPSTECERGCDAAGIAADDIARFHASLAAWMGESAQGTADCSPLIGCDIRVTWQGREMLRVAKHL